MSHHGIPREIRTDNGKQFDSFLFRQFSRTYGFKWTTSSPEYQQSNGQAESAVKIVKKIFKLNNDPYLALLTYRNTPLSCGVSPAQLLFGRRLRDRLPRCDSKLKPRTPNHSEVRKSFMIDKEKQKMQYNSSVDGLVAKAFGFRNFSR